MACADVGGAQGLWVLIYPESAGLLDARAGAQVRRLRAAVGEEVRKGQVLMELYLLVHYHQLQQQRDNRELDRRDSLRLASGKLSVDTSLAKPSQERDRYQELAATDAEKVRNLRWLSQREVVAPPDLRGGGGRAGPDQHQRQTRCGADPVEGSAQPLRAGEAGHPDPGPEAALSERQSAGTVALVGCARGDSRLMDRVLVFFKLRMFPLQG
jgi:hypothetical protein